MNFTVAIPDAITDLVAPDQVSPGDTVTVTVSYSAYRTRDILVTIHPTADPSTGYGGNTVTVAMGTGTVHIQVAVGDDIPIAEDAYEITALMVPEGGTANEALHAASHGGVDAVPATGLNARLAGAMNHHSVYPNPFSGQIRIETGDGEAFVILDITGKIMFDGGTVSSQETAIVHTNSWRSGIYILRLESGLVRKLVKH